MRVATLLSAALVLVSPALAAPVAQGGKSCTPFPRCLLVKARYVVRSMIDITQE